MRFLVALTFLVLTTFLDAKPNQFFLQLGTCKLPFDPSREADKINSSIFSCIRGNSTLDGLYIPNETVGVAGRIEIHGSVHFGSKHSLFYESFHEQIASHVKDEVPYSRNNELETLAYQYGNPAEDRFRLIVGQQLPAFGINRFPEIALNQILDPRFIWGLPEPGINFIYDTQDKVQVELQWIADADYKIKELTKVRNHNMSARYMHDFSILGGTRFEFSFLAKKSGQKSLGLGIISLGPKDNIFHVEWVRTYASLSNSLISTVEGTLASSSKGLNAPYQQLFRFAYEDPSGQAVRNFVLFDDVAFHYRLFAFGTNLRWLSNRTFLRFLIAFKQDETDSKRNRWIFATGVGGQL